MDEQIGDMVTECIQAANRIVEVKGEEQECPAADDRSERIVVRYPINKNRERFDADLLSQKMEVIVLERDPEGIEIGNQPGEGEKDKNRS